MAAVRISVRFTDLRQIQICEKQKLLNAGNPDLFNVILAADSVDVPEFLGKPGIAESAVLRQILDPKAFPKIPYRSVAAGPVARALALLYPED